MPRSKKTPDQSSPQQAAADSNVTDAGKPLKARKKTAPKKAGAKKTAQAALQAPAPTGGASPTPRSATPRSTPTRRGNQASTKTKRSVRLLTFKVTLIDPSRWPRIPRNKISRTLQLRGEQTFDDLHRAIFVAFERFDEHLYEFQFARKPMDRAAFRIAHPMACKGFFGEPVDGAIPSDRTSLFQPEFRPGIQFFYWFDFGDDWWHLVELTAIDEQAPTGTYPKLLAHVGEAPPQYPEMD
jgi:hypothetical protein